MVVLIACMSGRSAACYIGGLKCPDVGNLPQSSQRAWDDLFVHEAQHSSTAAACRRREHVLAHTRSSYRDLCHQP